MTTAMETATIEKVNNIQGNSRKEQVRIHLKTSAFDLATRFDIPLSILDLPSTEWAFEHGILKDCPKNVEIAIIDGIENDPLIFDLVKANMPKGCGNLILRDIDEHIKRYGDTYNFIWADYCGYPARSIRKTDNAFINQMSDKETFYKYPHMETMANYAKKMLDKDWVAVYAMTFDLSLRLKYGQEGLMLAMGGPAVRSMGTAIHTKVNQKLSALGIRDNVHLSKRIVYKGAKQHTMITLVYTIGFKPDEVIDQDWTKNSVAKTETTRSSATAHTKTSEIVKQKIRKLADSGMENSKIAETLNVTRSQVGATLAWHNNPDSFPARKN